MLLAGGAGLLDQPGGALLGGRDGRLGLGAGALEELGLLERGGVAQLLGLRAERDGVVVGLGAELVALDPGGLDLLVARTRRGAHQQGGLLVGVEDDRRGLLGGAGEHLLGLLARPAGLGAVALGLDLQQAGLLAEDGEVGGQPLGLEPGLADELVGDLLGSREQGRGRGLPGRGRRGIVVHPTAPLRPSPTPLILSGREGDNRGGPRWVGTLRGSRADPSRDVAEQGAVHGHGPWTSACSPTRA